MNVFRTFPPALRVACAIALCAGTAAVSEAQTTRRSVQPTPQPAAPAAFAGFGLPSPAGLPSPTPNPAGLSSPFPAGLSAALPPASVATTPVPPAPLPPATGNLAPGGRAAGVAPDAGTAPQTNVLGAAAYGGAVGFGVPAGRASPGVGSGPFTALHIAQSFLGADANRDGELTRGEAQRLTIMPYSFEEMDRNHDGILTRFEYEDGVR